LSGSRSRARKRRGGTGEPARSPVQPRLCALSYRPPPSVEARGGARPGAGAGRVGDRPEARVPDLEGRSHLPARRGTGGDGPGGRGGDGGRAGEGALTRGEDGPRLSAAPARSFNPGGGP